MADDILQGSTIPHLKRGDHKPTPNDQLNQAIIRLQKNKERWANEVGVKARIRMLERLLVNLNEHAEEWVNADLKCRGRTLDSWDAATSIIAGPALIMRLLNLYICVLKDILKHGKPKSFGAISTNLADQVTIGVFPLNIADKLLFKNNLAEIWLEPGVSIEEALNSLARPYQDPNHPGKVSLVLGAGNYSCLTIADILYKLINEKHVVLIKTHPITEYSGVFINKIFKEFIDEGFLQVVYGGVPEGEYLCQHEAIDEIHVTGSDKTLENIMFGSGKESQKNKMRNKPIQNKRTTASLGNVSPIIVVPGPWSDGDVSYQAENIVASMAFNSGFSCNASRMLVQQKSWSRRKSLLEAIKNTLQKLPRDKAYYPGAADRIKEALEIYPDAFCAGDFSDGKTPWVFVEDIDSNNENEFCFKREVFGSFMAETSIDTNSVINFMDRAVDFCNKTLWGNLNVMIIIHPRTVIDQKVQLALDQAIRNLNYGTVTLNIWPAFSYYLGSTSWGSFPGAEYTDIQSGIGSVHNPFMFDKVQKSILRAPFRTWPKPLFPTNKKLLQISQKLLDFEGKRDFRSLLRVLLAAL